MHYTALDRLITYLKEHHWGGITLHGAYRCAHSAEYEFRFYYNNPKEYCISVKLSDHLLRTASPNDIYLTLFKLTKSLRDIAQKDSNIDLIKQELGIK